MYYYWYSKYIVLEEKQNCDRMFFIINLPQVCHNFVTNFVLNEIIHVTHFVIVTNLYGHKNMKHLV